MELAFSPVVILALGALLVNLIGFGTGMNLERRRIKRKP
jgi:hypothetical protein